MSVRSEGRQLPRTYVFWHFPMSGYLQIRLRPWFACGLRYFLPRTKAFCSASSDLVIVREDIDVLRSKSYIAPWATGSLDSTSLKHIHCRYNVSTPIPTFIGITPVQGCICQFDSTDWSTICDYAESSSLIWVLTNTESLHDSYIRLYRTFVIINKFILPIREYWDPCKGLIKPSLNSTGFKVSKLNWGSSMCR